MRRAATHHHRAHFPYPRQRMGVGPSALFQVGQPVNMHRRGYGKVLTAKSDVSFSLFAFIACIDPYAEEEHVRVPGDIPRWTYQVVHPINGNQFIGSLENPLPHQFHTTSRMVPLQPPHVPQCRQPARPWHRGQPRPRLPPRRPLRSHRLAP